MVVQSPSVCIHCNDSEATVLNRGSLIYCDKCWYNINQLKSEKMISLNIKRSKETRAAMSASKRVKKVLDPEKWNRYYSFYLEQLTLQDKYFKGA